MSLNTSQKEAIEFRRTRIAEHRIFGRTQREIAGMVGVSLGTVNRDLKIIEARWRAESTRTVADHAASQLAEIARIKKFCWMSWDMKTLLAALRLEAYITGTIKAPGIHINIALINRLSEIMTSKGLDPADEFTRMLQDYADKNAALPSGEAPDA